MFLMGRNTGYRLVGMPLDGGMLAGMGLIILGFGLAAYGLMPPGKRQTISDSFLLSPEDAPLTKAHWIQIGLLAVALVIDVMKASTLGFVIPGMRIEYGLSFSGVAILPCVALLGTTLGSLIWGALADIYGRRAAILLAAVMFVGTSICGTMPSFAWNIFMCFVMGLAAGGMLPVANALIAEIMPTKHRGWCLVLLGGIGTIGAYFAISGLSALLQPYFGWRIMWLIGFPTGLVLIAMSPLLPESARFLIEMGRVDEAREMLARYGAVITTKAHPVFIENRTTESHNYRDGAQGSLRPRLSLGIALTIAALAWGFVNFGVLLWLPSSLIAGGRSVRLTSAVIARSTLIAIPTVALTTYLYTVWSTKRVLIAAIGVTTLGLLASLLSNNKVLPFLSNPLVSVSLLIIGTSAVISTLMPYSAESFPIRLRGRAIGWVAGCSKVGGVIVQWLASLALVPAFGLAAGLVAIPTVASLLLLVAFGHETRGRDLRELEPSQLAQPKQSWLKRRTAAE
jgi:putative MFS transporter